MRQREISIGDNHQAQIARAQHVLEWLASERARLEAELAHVVAAGAREQAQLIAFLQRAYGLDAAAPGASITVDSERGVLLVPDDAEAPAPVIVEPVEAPAVTLKRLTRRH